MLPVVASCACLLTRRDRVTPKLYTGFTTFHKEDVIKMIHARVMALRQSWVVGKRDSGLAATHCIHEHDHRSVLKLDVGARGQGQRHCFPVDDDRGPSIDGVQIGHVDPVDQCLPVPGSERL